MAYFLNLDFKRPVASFDFDQVFGDDHLHFNEPLLTNERCQGEIDLIVRLLGLAPGARVLDIPCGHGRITGRLAALGCDVGGVDNSPSLLDVARGAGGRVDYRQADMRDFAPPPEFDTIVNWFTSFGYFDAETDRAFLASWRSALKPGGKLLIDHLNRQRLLGVIAATGGHAVVLTERGDELPIDRTTFEVTDGRANTERITVRDGRVRRYRFSTFATSNSPA